MLSDFLNFKYPKFSSLLLFFSGFYLVFFSLSSFLMLFLLVLIAYFNPTINPPCTRYLQHYFISEQFLNQDFIEPKHLSNSWIEKYRISDIAHLEKKQKKKNSVGLGKQYQ